MLAQLIQRQVPIGHNVRFSLKDGREVIGCLVELGQNHVTVESSGGPTTVLMDMIGGWQVINAPLLSRSDSHLENNSSLEQHNEATPGVDKANDSIPTALSVSTDGAAATPNRDLEEVLRIVIEIEARFQANLASAKLEPRPPDFDPPTEEFRGKQSSDALKIWNRVKNKYENALKVNELGAKYGRLQSIISELETLRAKFPNSNAVLRLLGYFYWLTGNVGEAAEIYRKTAKASNATQDWYNLAALTFNDNDALTCYALEKVYSQVGVSELPNAWYTFVALIGKHKNYSALLDLSTAHKHLDSEQDDKALLEATVYLLVTYGNRDAASDLARRWITGQAPKVLTQEALRRFENEISSEYQLLATLFDVPSIQEQVPQRSPNMLQGYIHKYVAGRNFGFIRGADNENYFFHRSAVPDEELLGKIYALAPNERIQVMFETAQGPKGPLAIGITMHRTPIEAFNRAIEFADNGDYSKAIAQIKRVLGQNPNYPNASELYEKWREYARMEGVPRGLNPYARAKRVQLIEKDLDRAAQFFRQAIQQGDNIESAVKDLAGLLAQQGNPQESIRVLKQYSSRITDQQSLSNMLIGFHQTAGQYDEAIGLLEIKLRQASSGGKKAQIQWQIASCFLRKEDYVTAESRFREVAKLQPDNITARRNIALCLFKQTNYEEAERILNQILGTSPDTQSDQLLEAIHQARAGHLFNIDEIIIDTTLSSLSRETSGFTEFFLERCDFQGVPPDRVQKHKFNRTDVQKLVDLATQLGTRRPRDRAGYYLSAAKIVSVMEEGDPDQIYKYLCRSFASRADAAVVEGRPLDAAKELYAEALSVYDGDRSRTKDEQDALNALVRFIFSTLGQAQIPIQPKIPSIDETIETVLSSHPDRSKAFDAIAYLVFRSRYAANRVLKRLYDKTSLHGMALEYLKLRGVQVSESPRQLDDFVRLWNELQRKTTEEVRLVSTELRFVAKTELTTASLERSTERIRGILPRLFLGLDQQRITQLEKIFDTAHELCGQVTFEEQERLCIQIDNRCQDLLEEIVASPTKISIEEIYPVVDSLRRKISVRLEDLYERSTPQLTLRLSVESYTPDANQNLQIQIAVSNRIGCSPADALELVILEQEDSNFTLNAPEIKSSGSLRGGDQRILLIPLKVGKAALESQAFSLPVYAQYRTRSEETNQTPVNSFSIRLYAETDFEEIMNPYAAYAEGGVVGDAAMFYGREELIANVANAIKYSHSQSKCVVVYGQKRAGKSSVLYHLRTRLQEDANLLILDIGNIGAMLDEHSSYPLLYQILWTILQKLQYAIEDRIESGGMPLDVYVPTELEFYQHPTPLGVFKQVFDQFKRAAGKLADWKGISVVLLVDEFSYLYGWIVAGRVPDSFMKNWKALLQENYFSAVLVGQDVMPKFKQRYPNEFGTTQDERVTYLKREDATRLIDEPVRLGGPQGDSRYREKAIDRILDLTAGSPFYIQILCNRLIDYMNRKRARLVTEADVEQVKEDLIRGVNALGLDKFDNLINSGDTSADAISDGDALAVLRTIALNSQSGSCSRDNILCETTCSVDHVLDDLVRRDVIERQRTLYYSIRVGLFKEWLAAHQ